MNASSIQVETLEEEITMLTAQLGHIALGRLLDCYREIKARRPQIVAGWSHGMALALYVPVPEGNLIEI
jgi:hypothetical protein